MTSRLLVLAAALLLAGCQSSPYQPGKSSADIPATIDTVRLASITPVVTHGGSSDSSGQAGDPAAGNTQREPTEGEREVTAAVKAAIIDQFENFGMHVVEDDSRKPDLKVGVTLTYTPELGVFIHRALSVTLTAMSPDGQPLLSFTEVAISQMGLLSSLIESREDMAHSVARALIVKTVKELQRGTSKPTHALRLAPMAG